MPTGWAALPVRACRFTLATLVLALAGAVVAAPASATPGCGSRGVYSELGAVAQCKYLKVGSDTFEVPHYRTSMTFDVFGAGYNLCTATGGRAKGDLAVAPFDKFQINVGGQPTASSDGPCRTGGWNGGGNGGDDITGVADAGAGGAGASDVRTGANQFRDRLFVGGGGGGLFINAWRIDLTPKQVGKGGGLVGEDGGNGVGASIVTGDGGRGGTQTAGGWSSGDAGSAGFGFGGSGEPGFYDFRAGGAGGGGGWYGGGGSGSATSGPGNAGGGSGHVTSAATNVTLETGVGAPDQTSYEANQSNSPTYGEGEVIVSWDNTPVTATVTMESDASNPVPPGDTVHLTARVRTSTGAPAIGSVVLTDYTKGNGAAHPTAPSGCPCFTLGQGYLDEHGTFSVSVHASQLQANSNDIVAMFNDNYSVIPDTQSSAAHVTRAGVDQTISFTSTPPTDATVGSTYAASATATSGLPVTFSIGFQSTSICSVSGATVLALSPGTCFINANQPGSGSFNPAPTIQQQVVFGWGLDPVVVPVSVSGSQVQGGSPGFVYVNALASGRAICTTVDGGTEIGPGLDVGHYTIDAESCTGVTPVDADHYEVRYEGRVDGFVVTDPVINVTVSGAQTYGDTTPTFTYTSDAPPGVTIDGNVSCTGVGSAGLIRSDLNPFTYRLSGCSGLRAAGYAIRYSTDSYFVVNPAVSTVTVSGAQGYGGGAVFTFTDDIPGTVSDTVSCGKVEPDTAIDGTLPSGVYTIDPSTCSGYTAPHGYTPRYEAKPGGFLVSPSEILVTVWGQQAFGGSPEFEYRRSQDDRVTLEGTLTCTRVAYRTAITPTLLPGNYAVEGGSCSGFTPSDPENFRVTYTGQANGGFIVSPAGPPINVHVSGTQTYGGSAHLKTTDDAPSGVTLDGTLSCEGVDSGTHLDAALPVGDHTVDGSSCNGLSAPGYDIAYDGVTDDFVVSPTTIDVQVSGTQTYGGTPYFTTTDDTPTGVTLDGIINCDTVDSGTTIGATLSAGDHTVDGATCDGLSAAGYDINYSGVTDHFVVSPATIPVHVSGTQTFGGSPHFTQTNDAPAGAGLGGSLSCTTVGTSTAIGASLPVGAYTVKGSSCGGMTHSSNYELSYDGVANEFVVSQAGTGILYAGQQLVLIGNSLVPAATLSSPTALCSQGKSVSFSLDADPKTGVAGSYSLGSVVTNASGQATGATINTTGWRPGAYTVTARFAGSGSCVESFDEASLSVASPGDAASGGGSYSLSGSGRCNFGFTVRKVANTTNTYTGQLLLINNGKWRIKGTLTKYGLTATKAGSASGTGALYWWNQTLNSGLGGWQPAQTPVSFTINFSASSAGKKASPGSFGIQIGYRPVAPQPSALPNSVPQLLKGGTVNVS